MYLEYLFMHKFAKIHI